MTDQTRANPVAAVYQRLAEGPDDTLDLRPSGLRKLISILALTLLLSAAFAVAWSLPGVGPLSRRARAGGGGQGKAGSSDDEDDDGAGAGDDDDDDDQDTDPTDRADRSEAKTGAETRGNTDTGGQDTASRHGARPTPATRPARQSVDRSPRVLG